MVKRVLVILPNAFEIFEAAAFIDVLGWANQYGDTPIKTITAGISPEISCTFGGLQIRPDTLLSTVDAADFDAVAIPGGFEAHGYFEEAYAEVVLQTLRDFNASNKPVASICVGALPLGKSGILKGKNATTYNCMGEKRRQQLTNFGANLADTPIAIDENKITSTSPATAIDVALELLTKLTTQDNAKNIHRLMGFQ